MRVQFTTIMGSGKKQIFAEAIDTLPDKTVRVVASATTGLLDPDEATEQRAAKVLLERMRDQLNATTLTLHEMGMVP